MAAHSIPVDLFNPGQVFACMGLLEAADILMGDAQGRFEWSHFSDRFHLLTSGDSNPIELVLDFLKTAEVTWWSPRHDLTERDGGETEIQEGIASSDDPKPADLPGVFRGQLDGKTYEIPFGYWADGSTRFATTFKKSTNGASAHVRLGNALEAIKQWDTGSVLSDPFNRHARTESLFRLDPRGSVDPISGGFSPDRQRKGDKGGLDVRVATYPICELLAILGLEHARPEKLNSRQFAYCVWDSLLPPVLARAAIQGHLGFGRTRRFIVEHEEVKSGGGLDVRVATYPICELLAILGLEHARPEKLNSRQFAYCVWDSLLPPVLARAAIQGHLGFGRTRRFIVEHEEVKSGGDRKMNHVKEEITHDKR